MKSHKDLMVWQKSMDLVTQLYRLTEDFPQSEIYGLTNQIRRSAVSVPSNIAEGAARHSKKEFTQFLYISLGSLAEIETQLEIAANLGYLKPDSEYDEILGEIRKLLIGLIRSLKR